MVRVMDRVRARTTPASAKKQSATTAWASREPAGAMAAAT